MAAWDMLAILTTLSAPALHTPGLAADEQQTAGGSSCPGWCVSSAKDWATKCAWDTSCGAPDACLDYCIRPPPEPPAPPGSPPPPWAPPLVVTICEDMAEALNSQCEWFIEAYSTPPLRLATPCHASVLRGSNPRSSRADEPP